MTAKIRMNVYMSKQNHKRLVELAALPGVSKTAIVDDALTTYFNPEQANRFEDVILQRMNQFDLAQGEIARDQAVSIELLGQFILYWLTLTEPMRAGERDDAQRQGAKRFNYFIDQVGRRMGSQTPLSHRVFGDLPD